MRTTTTKLLSRKPRQPLRRRRRLRALRVRPS
jgi:hypothetical protein